MNAHVSNDVSALRPSGAGFELTVEGDVEPLSDLVTLTGHQLALVSVKGAAVRVTFDGSDPVSAGRGAIYAEGIYYWSHAAANAAKLVESVGSSPATLHVQPMAEG